MLKGNMKFVTADFIKFLSSNIFYQGALFVSDFYLLRIISKEQVGMWQYAMLLQSYTLILRLGIVNSFNRHYPYHIALENNDYAKKIYEVTFYHIKLNAFAQFLFFITCGLIASFIFNNQILGTTFLVMAVYAVFESLTNFQEALLRNIGKLKGINIAKLATAIAALFLIVLPIQFGFTGFLIRVVCIVFIPFFIMLFFTRINWKTSFNLVVWRDLFSDGWKFWLWSYTKTLLKSMPKAYIVFFGNITILGLYAPVNWLLLSFSLFTGSLTAYLYPILTTQVAKGETALEESTFKINLLVFIGLIPLAALGCTLLPSMISDLLPAYTEAIFPMQITLVASLFEIFSVNTTLWASKREWKKILISQLLSFLVAILSFVCVYFSPGILLLNVSYAVLAGSIINAIVISFLMRKETI
jgi:O-antigen/teichoic acid export membrane protein